MKTQPIRRFNYSVSSMRCVRRGRSLSSLVLVYQCQLEVRALISFCCEFTDLTTVPDFRSSTGLFSSLRNQHKLKASGKHLFDAAVYKSDSSTSSFHDMVRELSQMTRSAKPTLFHHMLATLAEEGRLLRLYTQNVDGIDTALEPLATTVPLDPKGPWPKTIQLHGGLEKMVCTKCGKLSEFNEALFEGPDPPPCRDCEEMERVRTVIAGKRGHGVGRLRPRMVLYNEFNPDEDAIGAVTAADLRSRPDAVIVVGTSLKVPGVRRIVREMCWVARGRRDGFTAWINSAPEPIGVDLKGCWDLVVRGDSDEVARQAALPKWDDKDTGLFSETTREMVEKIKRDTKLEIVVDVKHKAVETVQGIVTPGASPRHQSPAPARTSTISNHPIIKFKSLNPATSTIASKSTSTNAAPKTKRPSKKKAITEPKKQTQKITSAFNVTKVGNATVKSEKEPNPTTPQRIQLPMFPNLKNAELPLEPMSPNKVRQNLESSPLSNPPSSPILQHSPDYLNQTERQQSSGTSDVITYCDPNQRAMISPKSKPNNMNHLIH